MERKKRITISYDELGNIVFILMYFSKIINKEEYPNLSKSIKHSYIKFTKIYNNWRYKNYKENEDQ